MSEPTVSVEAVQAAVDALMHHDMDVCGYGYFEGERASAESIAGVALVAAAPFMAGERSGVLPSVRPTDAPHEDATGVSGVTLAPGTPGGSQAISAPHVVVTVPADAYERLVRVAEYVSRGRGFIGVEPYPDATARFALGALMDAAGGDSPQGCPREAPGSTQADGTTHLPISGRSDHPDTPTAISARDIEPGPAPDHHPQRGPQSDPRRRVADRLLQLNDADPDAWLPVLDAVFDVVSPELDWLRREAAYLAETGEIWRRLWVQVDQERSETAVRAEAAEDGLARIEARHQPETIHEWVTCPAHTRWLVPLDSCSSCARRPRVLCSNHSCRTWPCDDHLALHGETPTTCTHTTEGNTR